MRKKLINRNDNKLNNNGNGNVENILVINNGNDESFPHFLTFY